MELYKIRNKEGLYWCGKEIPRHDIKNFNLYFNDVGKTFDIFPSYFYSQSINVLELFKDCEIVKFELVEKEIIKIEQL
jgi:hypothetical protein